MLNLSKFAAVVSLLVGAANGDASDCGSPAMKISSISIVPDPPSAGQAAFLNAVGTMNSVVSNGTIAFSVMYLGIPLFSANAATCGNSTIEFPLNAGSILIEGLQNCPTTVGMTQNVNISVTLPSVTPPGDYVIIWNATDQNNNGAYCINATFTES